MAWRAVGHGKASALQQRDGHDEVVLPAGARVALALAVGGERAAACRAALRACRAQRRKEAQHKQRRQGVGRAMRTAFRLSAKLVMPPPEDRCRDRQPLATPMPIRAAERRGRRPSAAVVGQGKGAGVRFAHWSLVTKLSTKCERRKRKFKRLREALIGRTPGGSGVYLTHISSFTQASFLVTRARAISPTSTQHAPSSTHASSQRERDRAEGRRSRVRRRRREQVHQLQELFDGLIGRHATHENATAVVAAALLVRTPDGGNQG